MKHDILADTLCIIKNAEFIGKTECTVPASNIIKGVLEVVKKNGYIKEYKLLKDNRGGAYHIHLQGRINDCNVVRPHFAVKINEVIKWEKRFLPARETGILILTTSKGIMDQREATKQNAGGRLLGYVY